MLINVRVKTLDSRDHEFSVENDMTVRQFKDRIRDKTNIEPDLQRLIYCGRVMNDEHPLSDYDVNGKVVHLVQRPPPGSTPRTSSGSSTNNANGDLGNRRHSSPFIRAIDGMILGAMAIPMNANSGTTQTVTQSTNPSSTLCMNRITVARHMLNCANNIANYLEDPTRGLNNTQMENLSQQTMESTVFEVGISAVGDADVPQQDMQNLVQVFQGAVSAAFRQNGLSNITVDPENGTAQATLPIIIGAGSTPASVEIHNTISSSGSSSSSSSSSTTSASISAAQRYAPETIRPRNSTDSTASTSNENTSGEQTTSSSRRGQRTQRTTNDEPSTGTAQRDSQQTTNPRVLAEVVQQMRTVQTRLDPFIQQYYDILQNDPVFAADDTNDRESSQRVFDRVSEALHYMSHAQHAISDLMLDLSVTTPRHLCCRPILVEQSAVVSSGFAVPNIIARRTVPAPNIHASSTTTAATNNNTVTSAPTAYRPDTPSTATASGSSRSSTPSNPSVPRQIQVARLIQAVMNSVPANADVHVEFSQDPNVQEPRIEIEHIRIAQEHPLQAEQRSSASTQPNSAETRNSTNSSPERDETTARVTTATHPTTSTQTRSTARQQTRVHSVPSGHIRSLRPIPVSSMHLSTFDRYLPCNSHHIREPEQQQPERQNRGHQFAILRTPPVQRRTPFQFRSASANSRRPTLYTAESPTTVSAAAVMPTRSLLLQMPLNETDLNTLVPIFGSDHVQLQVRDFINLSPAPSTFNRIRTVLRQYITSTLSLAAPVTDDTIKIAINQVIGIVNQFLLLLPDLNIADYDARASIENLIRRSLPLVLQLIREDDSPEFGTRMLREIITFSKRLTVILLHSIGRASAQEFLKQIIEALFTIISGASARQQQDVDALRWLRLHFLGEIARRFQDIALDTVDVIEFLVIRRPPPPPPPVPAETPMETDTEEIVTEPSAVDGTLPEVRMGSETWHQNFNQAWLPVITRDISRQRRQSPQRGFSDAYLSGMSSKRRKLVNGTKPSAAEPNSMLGQGIRQVLHNRIPRVGGSGSSTSSTLSSTTSASTLTALNETIASNPHIQEPYGSYEQALLQHVQNRINTDPDFSPDRFPNTSKWAKKNK